MPDEKLMGPSGSEDGKRFARTATLFACVVLVCCGGGGLVLALIPLVSALDRGEELFHWQCDIALGSTTGTASPTTAPPTTASVSPSPMPTENPFASVTFAADDPYATARDRTCASAMRLAPLQGEPLPQVNTGAAAACAADLALRYPETGGTKETAVYVRDVVYGASMATVTGRCAVVRAPRAVHEADCGDPAKGPGAVNLPETVGAQGYCGKLVEPAAVSPGDLVFWDYRDNAATRAGIAVSATEMVSVHGGEFVRLSIPDDGRVQVKRVLREAS